jgi:hypothetical protein
VKRYISAFNVALEPGASVTTFMDQALLDRQHQLKKDIALGLITMAFVSADTGDSVKSFNASAGPSYSNATRPAANTVPVFTSIWNTDDNAPNWSDGANWRDAAGLVT